jgi:hypothetical protein
MMSFPAKIHGCVEVLQTCVIAPVLEGARVGLAPFAPTKNPRGGEACVIAPVLEGAGAPSPFNRHPLSRGRAERRMRERIRSLACKK